MCGRSPGAFYSIAQLPEPFHTVAAINPFFYLIDGIRFGFTGHADGSLLLGILVVIAVNAALWLLAHRLLARGYRLKARMQGAGDHQSPEINPIVGGELEDIPIEWFFAMSHVILIGMAPRRSRLPISTPQ